MEARRAAQHPGQVDREGRGSWRGVKERATEIARVFKGFSCKFKTMLEEFYADSPVRLKAAQFGLTLTVKKPASDTEQD